MLKIGKNYLKIYMLMLTLLVGFCCGGNIVSASDIYMYRECSNTEYYINNTKQSTSPFSILVNSELGLDFYNGSTLVYSAERSIDTSNLGTFVWMGVNDSKHYYNMCPKKIVATSDGEGFVYTVSGISDPSSFIELDIEIGDAKYLIFKDGTDVISFRYNSLGEFFKYVNLNQLSVKKTARDYRLNANYFMSNFSTKTKNYWDIDILDSFNNGTFKIFYTDPLFEEKHYSIYEGDKQLTLFGYLSSKNIGVWVNSAIDSGVGHFASNNSALTNFSNKYTLAIDACTRIDNNGDYSLFENSSEDVIKQMDEASDYVRPYIEEISTSNNGVNNIDTIYNVILKKVNINDNYIPGILKEDIQDDIRDYIESSSNIVDLGEEFENYSKLFANCSYKLENSSYGVNDAIRLRNIRSSYKEMLSSLGVVAIYDCEDLLGDFLEEIKIVLNVIRILVPIILILFGMIDFSQAAFAGSDDAMKKAQKKFTTRLLIAVAIFMVPTIINLLLELAHNSWPDLISIDNCNLF